MSEMTNVLHVYGQGSQHDDVWIVGDREGLLRLRGAIDESLFFQDRRTRETFTADGEGYTVHVRVMDPATLDALRLPYTDLDLPREGKHPAELEPKREAKP